MGRKKKENAKDVIVQGRIDNILNKYLENFCAASGMNKSDVVRSALEQFLKWHCKYGPSDVKKTTKFT